MRNDKWNVFKLLLLIFSLSLVLFWIYTMSQNKILEENSEGLSYIEAIHSGVQRVSKLELENSPDDHLVVSLDTMATKLEKYFLEYEEISNVTTEFIFEWVTFKEAVTQFRDNGDRDSLFVASENNYRNSAIITEKVRLHVSELVRFVGVLEICMIVNIIALALILLKILFDTISELQRNKELSKDMHIDISTGLYNRSKCQEMLNAPVISLESEKERIVLVFDLNDLKKTNDSLGHRVGDQLIACFAKQLKDAAKVIQYDVFVGRYGGDEFITYFSCADEQDVGLYLEELNYLTDKFNTTENKPFKLSFAVGHSMTTEKTKSFTMRQLFDIADNNMYVNKVAMKALKKQELREKSIEETISQDDEL